MRRTRAQIVADLEAQGLSFRTFTLEHRSPHHPADWDWNQRDLPHIPLVHGGFRVVPVAVEDDLCTMLSLQRIAGLRLPLLVAYHHDPASPRSRVYQTVLGPLALVIEASLAAVPEGTLVSTTYSVGGARVLRPLLPLAERFLRRNYARVHDEDEPLRARRAELRAWGYRFAADADGASYAGSLELDRRNVVTPTGTPSPQAIPIDGRVPEVLVGRADHLGLRLVRRPEEGRLDVYPRLCPHEGASLDGCAAEPAGIRCPWHGRRVAPLAALDLGERAAQVRETPHHRLELCGGTLSISPRSGDA